MKKLLLIRHAKAGSEISTTDFERPLKFIGLQDAEFMAERVKSKSAVPEILITSPALRTETTANIFSEHLAIPKPKEDKRIYEASLRTLMSVINDLPVEHNFIGLVGHNPAIGQVLHYLTGSMHEVPTCAIALIEFEVNDWGTISENTGKLTWYSIPKGD